MAAVPATFTFSPTSVILLLYRLKSNIPKANARRHKIHRHNRVVRIAEENLITMGKELLRIFGVDFQNLRFIICGDIHGDVPHVTIRVFAADYRGAIHANVDYTVKPSYVPWQQSDSAANENKWLGSTWADWEDSVVQV